jgi:transcriptional regulator with XRE-family HTH domain
MTVCETLKAARAQTGYSMREVAGMIGKSHQIVSYSEKNLYWLADDGEVLKRLCNVYGLHFGNMFEQFKIEKAAAPNVVRSRGKR